MRQSITTPRLCASLVTLTAAELVARLLEIREALTARRESPAVVAVSIWDLIDDVRRSAVAPVAGGSPDDFEEIDEALCSDEWPAYPDPECDGFRYEMGPTPLEVLEAEADDLTFSPTPETLARPGYGPSSEDWTDFHAWRDDANWTDADQVRAHGCC